MWKAPHDYKSSTSHRLPVNGKNHWGVGHRAKIDGFADKDCGPPGVMKYQKFQITNHNDWGFSVQVSGVSDGVSVFPDT
jgi:hypothetical protein